MKLIKLGTLSLLAIMFLKNDKVKGTLSNLRKEYNNINQVGLA